MQPALIITLVAGLLGAAQAQCANKCSNGRGVCNANAVCECYEGYTGADCSLKTCPTGRPFFAKAYTDDTSGLAHTGRAVECSNAGVCDYSTGSCKCFDRYSGKACDRLACPVGTNELTCSGHGHCETIGSIGKLLGPDSSVPYYDGNGVAYTGWEKDMLSGCVCDPGWSGGDCSQRSCPYGDSAQTTGQQRPLYRLLVDFSDVVSAANRLIKLRFASQVSTTLSFASGTPSQAAALAWISSIPALNSSETSIVITPTGTSPADGASIGSNQYEVLISLGLGYFPAIDTFFWYNDKPSASLFSCFFPTAIAGLGSGGVTTSFCSVSYVDTTRLTAVSALPTVGTTYIITITDTTLGAVNKFKAVKSVSGNPPVNTQYSERNVVTLTGGTDVGDGFLVYFGNAVGHTKDAQWTISSTGVVSNGLREYEACGRAGTCEPIYGVCQCFTNYGGPACDKDLFTWVGSTFVQDLNPIQTFLAPTNTYASSIVRIQSQKPQDNSFNYLELVDPAGAFFTVRGDGLLNAKGVVTDAGLTAQMLSASAASFPTKPTLDVRYASTTTDPTNGILRIRSDIALNSAAPSPVPSAVDVVKVQAQTATGTSGVYTTLFSVKNNGAAYFGRSGVTVTDDAASTKTTAVIGTTAAGMTVTGTGTYAGDFDGIVVTGPATGTYNSLRLVKNGAASLTIDQDLDMASTDSFTLKTTGATAMANAGNIAVTGGGAASGVSGGVAIRSGASVDGNSGGITISGGASTNANGGSVFIAPGNGGAAVGNVVIKDASASNNERVVVSGSGSITVEATSTLMLKGATGASATPGGTVSVTGGDGTATLAAGNVRIRPGSNAGGGAGEVAIADGAGVKRLGVAVASSAFYASDGSPIATFNTGANVAGSTVNVASAMTVSGAVTLSSAVSVNTAATVTGLLTASTATFGGATTFSSTVEGTSLTLSSLLAFSGTGGFDKNVVVAVNANSHSGGNPTSGTKVKFGFNASGGLCTVTYSGSATVVVAEGSLFPIYF